jgi:hypothetical protein
MTEQHKASMHKRFYRYLLEKVREDRYPSTIMLDILERGLRGRERQRFVEILLEKAMADRFPSIPMLERIARIAG